MYAPPYRDQSGVGGVGGVGEIGVFELYIP